MSTVGTGIWIDNAGAILVRFNGEGEPEVSRIESHVDPRAKTTGGAFNEKGRVGGASHSKPRNKRENQFARYFDEVWEAIREADRIAIFGPGTARKWLEARIREENIHPEIVRAETLDSVTDPQLVALVRGVLEIGT